ncbi:hypothetical protein [Lunatimonas salinarum]|uniref:hypothetical protein n=1 Tax=Lunatimonas salinarum TaxID=1774590 RepID=UPI001ADF5EBC|nr:hypothetical protein [Lunatimonas salinarum]
MWERCMFCFGRGEVPHTIPRQNHSPGEDSFVTRYERCVHCYGTGGKIVDNKTSHSGGTKGKGTSVENIKDPITPKEPLTEKQKLNNFADFLAFLVMIFLFYLLFTEPLDLSVWAKLGIGFGSYFLTHWLLLQYKPVLVFLRFVVKWAIYAGLVILVLWIISLFN